jgi:protein-L-isoaspartate(D-aspartate) O-methyltransferase
MQNSETNANTQYMPFRWTNEYLHQLLTQGKHKIVTNKHLSIAFQLVDRADFVPSEFSNVAYMDYDIDIGFGSTLEKPTTIAEALEFLNPRPYVEVLDIGTGSGYISALLAVACGEKSQVISIERVQFLLDIARLNIAKYPDLKNVKLYLRDGIVGLPDQAPFDIINISAAFEVIPEEVQLQLNIGGKLVAPTLDGRLHLIERTSQTEFKEIIKTIPKFDKIKTGIA